MTAWAHLEDVARVTQREQLLQVATSHTTQGATVPDKLRAIEDAAQVFEELEIPYALIGGLAVGIRSGIPRATLDVDFAIATQVDRDGLRQALIARGFVATGVFEHSINFKHTSGEPVQLAFDARFDLMIARAESFELGPFALRVVTKEDLIAMKKLAAADPKQRRSKALRDQADIALLEGDLPEVDEGW